MNIFQLIFRVLACNWCGTIHTSLSDRSITRRRIHGSEPFFKECNNTWGYSFSADQCWVLCFSISLRYSALLQKEYNSLQNTEQVRALCFCHRKTQNSLCSGKKNRFLMQRSAESRRSRGKFFHLIESLETERKEIRLRMLERLTFDFSRLWSCFVCDRIGERIFGRKFFSCETLSKDCWETNTKKCPKAPCYRDKPVSTNTPGMNSGQKKVNKYSYNFDHRSGVRSEKLQRSKASFLVWSISNGMLNAFCLAFVGPMPLPDQDRCWRVRRVGSENVTVHFWLDDRPCGNYLWALLTLKLTVWVESSLLCSEVYHWGTNGALLTLTAYLFLLDSFQHCYPLLFTPNGHVLTRICVSMTTLHFSPQTGTFWLLSAFWWQHCTFHPRWLHFHSSSASK